MVFAGCRARQPNICDVHGEGSEFDELSDRERNCFSFATYHQDKGNGYLGHFSAKKIGRIDSACRTVTESSCHLDDEQLAVCHIFEKSNLGHHILTVTEGLGFYCPKRILDSCVSEYNKRRESKTATLSMQEVLTNYT
jgi:hypothetical protein